MIGTKFFKINLIFQNHNVLSTFALVLRYVIRMAVKILFEIEFSKSNVTYYDKN